VALVEDEQTDIVEQRRIVPQGEVEFLRVATTMSRSRIASSSNAETPMLPYRADMVLPSGPNVAEASFPSARTEHEVA
jgi:hypothetical protein